MFFSSRGGRRFMTCCFLPCERQPSATGPAAELQRAAAPLGWHTASLTVTFPHTLREDRVGAPGRGCGEGACTRYTNTRLVKFGRPTRWPAQPRPLTPGPRGLQKKVRHLYFLLSFAARGAEAQQCHFPPCLCNTAQRISQSEQAETQHVT